MGFGLYRYVCYLSSGRGIGAPDDNGLAQQKSELSYRTGPQIFLSETVSNSLPIRLPKPKTVFLYITRMIMYHIFTHFFGGSDLFKIRAVFWKMSSTTWAPGFVVPFRFCYFLQFVRFFFVLRLYWRLCGEWSESLVSCPYTISQVRDLELQSGVNVSMFLLVVAAMACLAAIV